MHMDFVFCVAVEDKSWPKREYSQGRHGSVPEASLVFRAVQPVYLPPLMSGPDHAGTQTSVNLISKVSVEMDESNGSKTLSGLGRHAHLDRFL